MQAIKYKNVGLQGESYAKDQQIERCKNTINRLRECYVDHTKNAGLDNVVVVELKHTSKVDEK